MNEISLDKFGLTERDRTTLETIFKKYPEVKEIRIFGSRAKGNFNQGSDLDLAVMNEHVSSKTMSDLVSDFSESNLPYRVDLVNFSTVQHSEFIDHINRIGKIIYIG